MAYVSLADLKKHLNVDFSDDDDYITGLESAAESSIVKYIQQPLVNCEVSAGVLDPALCHAIKLIVANFYANREPVAYGVPQVVPYTLTFLLNPYILYV